MKKSRRKITLASLMVVVGLSALVANQFRPISEEEAVKIATGRFREIPGGSAWSNLGFRSYRTEGADNKTIWIVNILNPTDNQPIAQVSTSSRGKVLSTVVSLPGSASPTPVEILTEPLPPPHP